MFGMGKQQKDPTQMEFDLEKDLKSDPSKLRATKEQLDSRVQDLKGVMRRGEDKATFDNAQTLLHAYLAAQKVVGRATRKIGE